ncbi:polyprenyl synthetase family protein [Streptomyces sp. SID12501]|uniref:Polyprenyl synthetase family protein n=2 Tax=Streptomyces sp. SID12501 TaxID=2706042 RepID=A0A6B3BZP7_9ACTN|nr:polyprenyl synthetase family protein [Streptomyces sp. SID12501]NEC89686.1 polyprenyl synthetase family protein [Streptomyces sp. SID12501]
MQLLAQTRDLVDPEYRRTVDRLQPKLRLVAGYHIGWWDTEGLPCAQHGKGIRPAFALSCARAVSGEAGVASSLPAAVAVELVHDFSLLHDDVMDGDLVRRHRPTAWKVYGVGHAILAGDALLALAVNVVGGAPLTVVLSEMLLELCAGQVRDLECEQRSDIPVEEGLLLAEEKTGALLGAACQLGALSAGAEPDTAALYRRFGRELGVAFQLIDDVLGLTGVPGRTGKPVGADLLRRKKSLPVLAAMASDASRRAEIFRVYGREGALGDRDVERLLRLIEEAGGLAWARAEADRRLNTALELLREAGAAPAEERKLRALAELVTYRDR